MKVLFDTNVILDHLLAREPHVKVAEQLLSLVDTGRIEGIICATTATTIDYLLAKHLNARAAREHMETLLQIFDVAKVDRDILLRALHSAFDDYEDAVSHEVAVAAQADAIVTRNVRDFSRAALLPALSPAELLAIATRAQGGVPEG